MPFQPESVSADIRPAVPDDAADLVSILDQVGREGRYIANDGAFFSVEHQREMIVRRDPDSHLILVADCRGRVVGTFEMVRGNLAKNRHTATFAMALLKPFRGRGIGAALLARGEAWAVAQGVEKIHLAVFATNLGALSLYHKAGYVEEGRRRDQFRIAGEAVDEILMAKFFSAQASG